MRTESYNFELNFLNYILGELLNFKQYVYIISSLLRLYKVFLFIYGVNIHLTKRFLIMPETMNGGYSIHSDSFKNYIKGTFQIYLDNHPMYPMASIVHKIQYMVQL